MLKFLIPLLSTSLFLSSCAFRQEKEINISEAIKGDWLILYPDHELINEKQRRIYSKAQDSIVGLLGLKTISFRPDGSFLQTDSLFKPAGKWHLNPADKKLFIRNAGKGLDFFQGNLLDIKNDTMRIVENIVVEDEIIKVTWFLKRITDKKPASLFTQEKNWWRKKNGAESDTMLRRKVKAMLSYYSIYYEMVSKESIYFLQTRVFLPFSYYQHSMGLKPFYEKSNFSQLFHDNSQAQRSHAILAEAMDKLKNKSFPRGDNFVIEYAIFLNQLAEAIEE